MKPQFGDDITIQSNNGQNMTAVMHCTRMAGRAIIRVVRRCNDAKENNNLDLSDCQLMHVPDAVYHLMRHTELKGCNLSSNVITKIPPKFSVKFSLITELNLSHNRMSKLPDELVDLSELERLDISHNSFVSLPRVAFKLPKLTVLNAEKNFVTDVDVEVVLASPVMEELNLQQNPLSRRSHQALSGVTTITVHMSERQEEDWENLDIL